jgi:putative peptidoglycan lipid II flippase
MLNSTVKGLFLFLIPISALTIAQTSTVIRFVFSNTRLHPSDFQATGNALAIFSLGMFAWAAQYVFSRGFYATQNTWTPALVGTITTVVTLPFYWFLVHKYQYLGLALASSGGIFLYMLVLFLLLNRHTQNRDAGRVVLFFGKITLASTVAGLLCFRLTAWFQSRLPWQSRSGALFILVVVTGVGILLTAAMAKILGISELNSYFRKMQLRRAI